MVVNGDGDRDSIVITSGNKCFFSVVTKTGDVDISVIGLEDKSLLSGLTGTGDKGCSFVIIETRDVCFSCLLSGVEDNSFCSISARAGDNDVVETGDKVSIFSEVGVTWYDVLVLVQVGMTGNEASALVSTDSTKEYHFFGINVNARR